MPDNIPLVSYLKSSYTTINPTVQTNEVAINKAVSVAVGGFQDVAGANGDLKRAVHEMPAIFGAPALHAQVNDASKSFLTVGNGQGLRLQPVQQAWL